MKTTKRIFALLMMLFMLLGMAPTVHANDLFCEGGCTPGTWYWDMPGTCVDPGIQNCICAVCGNVFTEREVYGDHQWGSWGTVKTPSCTEDGQEKRTCKLCDKVETRKLPKLGYQWGDWWHQGLPTCTEKGVDAHRCELCNLKETKTVAPLGHAFGEWYIVREPAPGVTGLEERVCANCGLTEHRELPALEGEPIAPPQCILTLSSAPANGMYFVLGEEVTFTETWTNTTGETLFPFNVTIRIQEQPASNAVPVDMSSWDAQDSGPVAPGATGSHSQTVTVTEADVLRGQICAVAVLMSGVHNGAALDDLKTPFVIAPCGSDEAADGPDATLHKTVLNAPANGVFFVPGETIEYSVSFTNSCGHELHDVVVTDPLKGGNEDAIVALEPVVAPHGSVTGSFHYTVTEEDAQRGQVYNVAGAEWFNPEIEEFHTASSNTVERFAGYPAPTDIGMSESLSLTMKVLNTPANGQFFIPTEIVQFAVSISNHGTSIEWKNPEQALRIQHALGSDSISVPSLLTNNTHTYPIEYVVTEWDALCGSVSDYAFALRQADYQIVEYSNTVSVPCGSVTGAPPLMITKFVESMPLNGTHYAEGEAVSYRITYTNTADQTISNVLVYDSLLGLDDIAFAEKLEAGESRSCYYQYTVTAADAEMGFVENSAYARYEINGEYDFQSSGPVHVLTRADGTIPALPGLDLPGYTPGGGWETPIEPDPDGNLPFGVIDTAALHGGENHCQTAVTARDNASASYETTFCSAHSAIQANVLLMSKAAAAPEMQMQACAYAVALWRAEVESLYNELFAVSDSQAKSIVTAEYIRFLTHTANYEAMLNVLYPDQPALVAQKIAALWQDKAVALCCEMHSATRADSLLSVTPAAGAAATECACTITEEQDGKQLRQQTYCAQHAFPFSMVDALLGGRNTADAWAGVRRIWGVELNAAYQRLGDKLGESKDLCLAEYAALVQWMQAREASLIALYPHQPELVAQTMTQFIMDKVADLCRLAQ